MNHDPTDVVGRRIGATLVDGLVLGVVFVVVGIATGGASSGDGQVSVRLQGAEVLLWAAISLLYYFATEAVGGQTLGKRALGIRVVRGDGSAPGAGAILVRTLLRVVDVLPFAYIVGLVSILATGQRRQRIGDLAAGTTVVRA